MSWIVWPSTFATLPRDRHAVIEASAGTGKTFTLEHLIVREIVEGTSIDRLLVVTFTEKATDELRRRVRALIEEIPERPAADAPPGATHLDALQLARLAAARDGFERATISTIHGFCQRVLAEHAFDGGRLLREELAEREGLVERAAHQTLTEVVAPSDALRPWLEAYLQGGETVEKLIKLFGRAVSLPEDRLSPRFDAVAIEAAWRAIPVEAARKELKSGKVPVTYADKVTAILDVLDGDLFGLLRNLDVLEKANLKTLQAPSRPGIAALCQGVVQLLPRLAPLTTAVLLQLLPAFRRTLAALKHSEGVVDFDDLLVHLARALDDPQRGPALVAALRAQYDVALIDEFQDTDEIQWSIFRTVFAAAGHRLIVIGDPKQAIYGFRGADVETYQRATAELIAQGAAVSSLDTCFRASAELVEAYSALLADGVLVGDPPPPIRTPPGAPKLHDPTHPQPLVLLDLPPASAGLVRAAHGQWIAGEIARLVREVELEEGGHRRRLQPGDVYVLTYNEVEGRNLGVVLRDAGLPVAFYKQDGLFQTAEAAALRDVLAAVASPGDRSATLRALLTPLFDVPLDLLPHVQPGRAHRALEHIADWAALGERRRYAQLFGSIFDRSGILRRAAFVGNAERSVTNYLHLAEVILEWIALDPPSVGEVVAWMDRCIADRESPPGQSGNVQRLESDAGAVQIMTVHKSKGLEAPVVFLLGGWFANKAADPPFAYRQDDARWHDMRSRKLAREAPVIGPLVVDEDQREIGRLSYVAMTRAKARVYVATGIPKALPYDGRHARLARRARVWIDALRDSPVPETEATIGIPAQTLRAHASTILVRPARSAAVVAAAVTENAAFAAWTPPPDLLQPPPDGEHYQRWREHEHAPVEVTSYSRIKREAEAAHDAIDADTTIKLGEDPLPPPLDPRPDELPPGPETGVFLHQLLERVPLVSVAGGPSLDTWRARPDVRELVDAALLEHRIDPAHRLDAERLVHAALIAPLPLEPELTGLAAAGRVVREMEFLFPWEAPIRTYVKGYLDVVIEHAGRTWIVDWKSDRLGSYDAGALAKHVDERYRLQVQLYALALARIVQVKDVATHAQSFGGVVYVFLRGLGTSSSAIHVERPGWALLEQWAAELPGRAQARVDERGQGLLFGELSNVVPMKRRRGR